jgi:hypothetical protein
MSTKWKIILILTIVAIVLMVFHKPIKKVMTRGYRNKNPGNIRLNGETWQGEIKGTDEAFKTFHSMPFGYRGIFVVLRSYFKNRGINTIEEIINVYAPSADNNDTEAYINAVSNRTGIAKDQPLSFNDAVAIKNIVAAISQQENGITPDLQDIDKGYKLFLAS